MSTSPERYSSPLRYPGGKAKVANYVKVVLLENQLSEVDYVEPYAGGASVGLSLLFENYASHIHINDFNPGIFSFWKCVFEHTEDLCSRISSAPLDLREWQRQREIYASKDADVLLRGFSTFYLNRTNRSGIISRGGVIGGLDQTGKWKIDARFNREELIRRVKRIARFKSRITLTNEDAGELLARLARERSGNYFFYLDPPYFAKGARLYDNFYTSEDHRAIATQVAELSDPWIVSYDAVPEVLSLYKRFPALRYSLSYSASRAYSGSEVMFFSERLAVPDIQSAAGVSASLVSHIRDQTIAW